MEIEKAFKRLLIKEPFYGLFCMSLPRQVTSNIDTLCVAKRGLNCELCINPDFWNKHSDDEQIAMLKHEISHICLQHMLIDTSFDNKELFNIAADMEVNSYIENLPEAAVRAGDMGLPPEQGTKYYYEELVKQANSNKQNGDSDQSSSESNSESGSENTNQNEVYQFDDHSTWKDFDNMSDAAKQLITNNLNRILVETADQVQKSRGLIPENLSVIIDKLREKKPEVFNWKAYFRRLLGSIYDVNIKLTRRKQSKRFTGAAGVQHRKKVSILVAVDTSGSVSCKELADFFNEIDYIYKAGARITILECDANISDIVEYDGKTIPEIKGRGGTDFNPVIEWYIQHKKEYASLVYFTDGYCSLPDKHPSGVIWIITSNGCEQDYPGKTIYIPKGNESD